MTHAELAAELVRKVDRATVNEMLKAKASVAAVDEIRGTVQRLQIEVLDNKADVENLARKSTTSHPLKISGGLRESFVSDVSCPNIRWSSVRLFITVASSTFLG